MIARRKESHAGAGHVKYLHFVVICVIRCIYNKSAELKRHDRKSFHNLKRKGISALWEGRDLRCLLPRALLPGYQSTCTYIRTNTPRLFLPEIRGESRFDLFTVLFRAHTFVRARTLSNYLLLGTTTDASVRYSPRASERIFLISILQRFNRRLVNYRIRELDR